MSTNKTKNYGLHSWDPKDDFHLSEINENFTTLDGLLKAETQARTQQMGTKADTATVTAIQTALNSAARMLCGSYAGTGNDFVQTIDLKVHPLLVLVCASRGAAVNGSGTAGMATRELGAENNGLTITTTGFTVTQGAPYLNNNTMQYTYLVFY